MVGFWHEHTRPDRWLNNNKITSDIKTTTTTTKVVEYYPTFSLRDNWVEIKRENVMVGQEYNFNQLTSEEVHLQRNMMIMMLLVMIIIMLMIIIIIIIIIMYYYYVLYL